MANKAVQNVSIKNSVSSSDEAAKITKSLNGFYDLVGHKPEEVGTIAKMAAYLLVQGASPAMVIAALDRCVKECRFPVRLPDIMQRIVGMEVSGVEADMRAAWDVVIKYCKKYVGSDPEGNYGPEHGFWGASAGREASYPILPQRLLDCVRRTGGWRQYKRMTEADVPFLQKRFFEEYQAWTATEAVVGAAAALLEPRQLKQLSAGKAMEPAEAIKNSVSVKKAAPMSVPSEAQIADRRQILKQQAAAIAKQREEIGAKA
jgi:hypothetical protein